MATKRTSPAISVDLYAAAIDAIPGFKAAQELVQVARRVEFPDSSSELVDRYSLVQQSINRATDAIRSGQPFPSSVARETLEPEIVAREPAIFAEIHAEVLRRLEEDAESCFRRGVDSALAVLRTVLEAVLAAVRIDPDGDSMVTLVAQYDDLRRAQSALLARYVRSIARGLEDDLPTDLAAQVGYWRDSIDRGSRWATLRLTCAARSSSDTPSSAAFIQWLSDVPDVCFDIALTTPWWPDAHSADHLRWLASEGQPWLPTIEDAIAAHTTATAAIRRVFGRITEDQQAARAEHYRITGAFDAYRQIPIEDRPLRPPVTRFDVERAPEQPNRIFEPARRA